MIHKKNKISTIASTISSRWYNVDEKLRKEKEKFLARVLPLEEEEPLVRLREQEKKIDVIF